MRKLTGLLVSLALVAGLALPVGASPAPAPSPELTTNSISVLVPGLEINPARVSYGAYIYVKWSKYEVRRIVNRYGWVYPGATTLGVAACGLAPSYVRWFCRLAVVGVAWSVWTQFKTAARYGQCVVLAIQYNGWVRGVWRYRC